MNPKLCIKARISGKVQNVFYRKTTKEKARELGLTGWVKNLDNGEVELLACGERDAVMQLTDWLWEGPERAEVSNVHWEETDWETLEAFDSIHSGSS